LYVLQKLAPADHLVFAAAQHAKKQKEDGLNMRKRTLWCGAYIAFMALSAAAQNTFPASGSVGIGTTTPTDALSVNGDIDIAARLKFANPAAWGGSAAVFGLNGSTGNKRFLFFDYFSGIPLMAINDAVAGGGVLIGSAYMPSAATPSAAPVNGLAVQGSVGIGTTSPGAALEVNGNVKLTQGSGASITYADGTLQSTAWTGTACGGDYAESVDVTGDRTQYESGDVLVIDPDIEGNFLKSAEPYSTSVSGIFSTKPGFVGRRQTTDKAHMKDEVPMAMVGIVPTKVSAENGPIKPGDLLVTSSKLGYAMKGTDRSQMPGAVIGKALGHLIAGTGVIEVLVSLQ
jgi:hypothetical protein